MFSQLRVWVDANSNGVEDVTIDETTGKVSGHPELKKLDELGITELDYNLNRFIQNGRGKLLASKDLDADVTGGVHFSMAPNGIEVHTSDDGKITLYVTKLDETTPIVGGSDFVTVNENQAAVLSLWGQGGLLNNDDYGTPGVPNPYLQITGAMYAVDKPQAASGQGSGSFNTGKGSISILTEGSGQISGFEYTPSSGTLGQDKFWYQVTAPNGSTDWVDVNLTIQNVNDPPAPAAIPDADRAIYGWGVTKHVVNNDSNYSYWYTRDGEPIYQPYKTVAGRKQIGWGDYAQWGPLVDTGMPLEQFPGVPAGEWGVHQGIISIDGADYLIGSDWKGNYQTFDHNTSIGYENATTGKILPNDPDVGDTHTYNLIDDALFGHVALNQDGTYSYVGDRLWSDPLSANPMALSRPTLLNTNQHTKNDPSFIDQFQVQVTDSSGASKVVTVDVTHYGEKPPATIADGGGGGGCFPVVIDLNGDGVHFTDVNDSNVFFVVSGEGWRRRTSWASPEDGLLAIDLDGNGKITQGAEISFTRYVAGAKTDLEGLKAFDSNGDNVLTAEDDRWAEFGVWQDSNQNGITDAGEFRNLDAVGISVISLSSDGQFSIVDGQSVNGMSSVLMKDGTARDLADVTLRYNMDVLIDNPDGTASIVNKPLNPTAGQRVDGSDENELLLGYAGDTILFGGGG